MDVFLGIDIGTSATKVTSVDADGTHLVTTGSRYELERKQAGWAEQNPKQWWDATVDALSRLREEASDSFSFNEVRGIGLSGQMHSLVCLDEHGAPLGSAISWADQRTHAECTVLRGQLGRTVLDETGNAVNTGFTLPKLLWLRANEPELFDRIRHIVLPKDFVRYKLTNEILTDFSDASGTLMFNTVERKWSDVIMRWSGLSTEILPDVAYSAECAGYLSVEASSVTGLPARVPVYVGSSDVAAAVIGSGAVSRQTGVVSLGSAGQAIVSTGTPQVDRKSRVNLLCHGVPNEWMLMGAIQNAGNAIDWFMGNSFTSSEDGKRPDYEQIEKRVSELEMHQRDPIFLPYLTGERTPHMDETAAGVLFGLRPHHGRYHGLRAVYEGIAFAIRDSVEVLREMKADAHEFRLCGGGTASGTLLNILADNLLRPLEVSSQRDASAYGGALWAWAGSKGDLGVDVPPPEKGTEARITPSDENASFYENRFRLYQKLYRDLRPSFECLVSGVLKSDSKQNHG